MKIVHTASGKAYHLIPGTQLEIERPNLFFNEYGEQSLPVDLPDTDLNRQLTGYPDLLANLRKPVAGLECSIHDGDFFVHARQALLGMKRGEKITTSFYLNEGAFLSRIQDVPLPGIFGEETIPGVRTVAEGIAFCSGLMDGGNPHYGIFPVVHEGDAAYAYDKMLNKLEYDNDTTSYKLWNAVDRTLSEGEGDNARHTHYPAGCFITPFIRAVYLLRRVLKHFGYELNENLLTSVEPFKSMVFVNNTADALLGGTIRVGQLVPDITCSELIDLFRKKFCCEFYSDETTMTVGVIFMKDLAVQQPDIDLSDCLTGTLDIEFATYKRLVLKPREVHRYGDSESLEEFGGLSAVRSMYPTAYYSDYYGGFYRHRYNGEGDKEERLCTDVLPYDDGGNQEAYEVEIPETLCPEVEYGVPGVTSLSRAPYIGGIRYLNSKLVKTTSAGDEEQEEDANELKAMLLLVYWNLSQNYNGNYIKKDAVGGLHARNYGYITGTIGNVGESVDLYEYSLCYNGAKGIYSMFWREFDTLLRNALHKVTAELYITQAKKHRVSPFKPVCIDGVKLLPDVLRYTVGAADVPVESSFYSANLQAPIAYGEKAEEMGRTGYYWKWHSVETEISEDAFTAAGGVYPSDFPFIAVTGGYISPPRPTREQYEAGGRYHGHTSYVAEYDILAQKHVFRKVEWWLAAMKDV